MTLRYLILFAFVGTGPLSSSDLKLTDGGVSIEAGSLGTFVLTYPEFEPASQLVEVRIEGAKARVTYDSGARVLVGVEDGTANLSFEKVPEGTKSWKMTTLLDIGFAKGGSWMIDDLLGDFPAEKAVPPQIVSRHGRKFSPRNAQGQSLSLVVPEHAYQQLTDNREWNWAVYHWQFFVPWSPDRATAAVTVWTDLDAVTKLIDPFGQNLADHFSNKLGNEAELRADLGSDEAYYGGIIPPETDRYGGLPGTKESLGLAATGFFHVERKNDKWWLVDPDGNAFFHLGVCGFAPNDDYTYVKGREGVYEWLPSAEGEFASAFRPGDGHAHFSFYLANTIRKFGRPYDYETHAARMIGRLRKWGFNSIGAFTPTPERAHREADFPYVTHLPSNVWEGVPRIPGAHEVWDPFDPAVEAKLAENFARELPPRAQDPLLIGWFIVNEPRFDDLPRVLPGLDGSHACKRRFVEFLRGRHGSIGDFNAAWGGAAKSFDQLSDAGLAVSTEAAKADVSSFVAEFLELYFSQVERLFREHDPNHLLLGCRLQPVTIEDETLCRIMGRHVDVVSYNYYTYGVDTAALRRYHEWSGGKPMMLSEFFWSSPKDSGLVGGRAVETQRERGLAYRNYVEQSAATGFVVGIEWFTLVDQATTGRWFSKYNGESYNTGLLSVADRPWKEMLGEMMKTNHSLGDLLLGRRDPFHWDDPRFSAPQ